MFCTPNGAQPDKVYDYNPVNQSNEGGMGWWYASVKTPGEHYLVGSFSIGYTSWDEFIPVKEGEIENV